MVRRTGRAHPVAGRQFRRPRLQRHQPRYRKWHGKVVHLSSLRLRPESGIEAPDTRLTKWHYKQCVRMHLQGFWVGRESS
jgi:hypothetical protein